MTKIKAIIWDLDGTVADSMYLHTSVESELFKEYGRDIPYTYLMDNCRGIPFEKTFRKFVKDESINTVDILKEKHEILLKRAKGNIKEILGATKIIKELNKRGFLQAIGSSGHHAIIKLELEELNLQNIFKVVSCVQDVEHGKPAPDIFIHAAKQLNVKAEECIVIGDGHSDIIAAKAANMKSIALVEDTNNDWPANLKVTKLEDINLDFFNQ